MNKPQDPKAQDKQLDAEAGLDEATLDGVVGGTQTSVRNDTTETTKPAEEESTDNRFAKFANGRFA
jgi:hypothetical protein